jgi:hypothetical protein
MVTTISCWVLIFMTARLAPLRKRPISFLPQALRADAYNQGWLYQHYNACTLNEIVGNNTQMNNSIFWDAMPYSLLKINQCSRETHHLHFQGWRVNHAKRKAWNRQQAELWLLHASYSAGQDILLWNLKVHYCAMALWYHSLPQTGWAKFISL